MHNPELAQEIFIHSRDLILYIKFSMFLSEGGRERVETFKLLKNSLKTFALLFEDIAEFSRKPDDVVFNFPISRSIRREREREDLSRDIYIARELFGPRASAIVNRAMHRTRRRCEKTSEKSWES